MVPALLTEVLALPVRLELAVSVAVTVCWPVVWNVTEKVCRAGVGGDERVVRRQGGLRVGAGEGHRAGVAGGDVAIGIFGGDASTVLEGLPGSAAGGFPVKTTVAGRRRADGDAGIVAA